MINNNDPLHHNLPSLAAAGARDGSQTEAATYPVKRVEAVVMFCDLRGFTALSNSLPQDEVMAVLHGYFNLVVPVIEAFGGEVLQFIGDGILAVFHDCTDRDGVSCNQVVDAAIQVRNSLSGGLVAGRTLQAGIALHAGEVFYGEIGAGKRSSLTVIGPVVNLTSRLETLCHLTGQPILVSATFARRIGVSSCVYIGSFTLKGFDELQEVYAPLPRVARQTRFGAA